MEKFFGDFQALKDIVLLANVDGEWRELPNGQKQFRTKFGAVLNWWETSHTLTFQGPSPHKDDFTTVILSHLGAEPPQYGAKPELTTTGTRRVFVVYGHDNDSLKELELVLLRLGIKPFIMQSQSGGGETIIETLEAQIGQHPSAEFGIVLMTPDDEGYAIRDGESKKRLRARQNVILEMGMLLSSLTRKRVAMLVKGDVEHPSDIQGIIYLRYEKSVFEQVPALCQHLRQAGFEISHDSMAHAMRA